MKINWVNGNLAPVIMADDEGSVYWEKMSLPLRGPIMNIWGYTPKKIICAAWETVNEDEEQITMVDDLSSGQRPEGYPIAILTHQDGWVCIEGQLVSPDDYPQLLEKVLAEYIK